MTDIKDFIKKIVKVAVSFLMNVYHQIKTAFDYYVSSKTNQSFSYEEAIKFLNGLRPYHAEYPIISFPPVACDLTIILPVYNAEKYIIDCLNSIIHQKTTFRLQVIVIDDGSTDHSAQLIKEKNYLGIDFYSISNIGVGAARNFGLNRAKGKYVMFIDADDQLLPNAIELLMEEANKQDACIVQGNLKYVYENNQSARLDDPETKTRMIDVPNERKFIFNLKGYPVAKVFKRELFAEAGFPAYKFEDTLIWLTTYHRAQKIVVLPDPVYVYTIHKNSESGRISAGSVHGIDTFYVVPFLLELNKRLGIPFNRTLYRQVLFQFGRIMYDRNRKADDQTFIAMLSGAKIILEEYEQYTPDNLNRKERYLKKAILNVDLKLYKSAILYL